MVISVTASTTQGSVPCFLSLSSATALVFPPLQPVSVGLRIQTSSFFSLPTFSEQLTEEELARVMEAADLALHLDSAKQRIFDYVESKMYFLAPNLAHICGATIAAKLLGAAGGLTALSKMPADVIQLLGAKKTVSSGFSAANTLPHTGFVYYSDVVQEYPPEYRRKAARLVSTKIALAARVDSYREAGVTGATVGLCMTVVGSFPMEPGERERGGRGVDLVGVRKASLKCISQCFSFQHCGRKLTRKWTRRLSRRRPKPSRLCRGQMTLSARSVVASGELFCEAVVRLQSFGDVACVVHRPGLCHFV